MTRVGGTLSLTQSISQSLMTSWKLVNLSVPILQRFTPDTCP